MRARVWILAVVLVAILMVTVAACGGDDDESDSASPTTTAATTTAEGGGAGAEVFASAGCGTCHTLAAAGTSGTTGPNLDDLQPDAGTVEEQVRNGGGGMPAFEGQLSDEEIEAVATYVAESAGS